MTKPKVDENGFAINPDSDTPSPTGTQKDDGDGKSAFWGIFFTVAMILWCISMPLSGYIAWQCYAIDLTPVRVFKTVLACIFSYAYLAYFFVLRIILRVPCFM